MMIPAKTLEFIWTILNVIDYDIYKEVKADFEEFGEADIVTQLAYVIGDICTYYEEDGSLE